MPCLYVAADLVEAQLLLHRLSAAGITGRLVNEHFDRLYGVACDWTRPQIWLDDGVDFPQARLVIAEWLALPITGAEWQCRCGANNPHSFELCWECGDLR